MCVPIGPPAALLARLHACSSPLHSLSSNPTSPPQPSTFFSCTLLPLFHHRVSFSPRQLHALSARIIHRMSEMTARSLLRLHHSLSRHRLEAVSSSPPIALFPLTLKAALPSTRQSPPLSERVAARNAAGVTHSLTRVAEEHIATSIVELALSRRHLAVSSLQGNFVREVSNVNQTNESNATSYFSLCDERDAEQWLLQAGARSNAASKLKRARAWKREEGLA